MFDALAHNCGYIMAHSNVVQAETSVENIVSLYRTAAEYGTYDLPSGQYMLGWMQLNLS